MNELWQRLLIGAEQIGTAVPALVGAGIILAAGYFLARQVQRWVDDTLKRIDFNRMAHAGGLDEAVVRTGSRLDPIRALAKLAKSAVVVISIFMALQQVGVAEDIVTSAFTLILGAVALGVGLAFGLGNRELAGEITRRWYEEGQRRDRRKTDRPGVNTPPNEDPPILD